MLLSYDLKICIHLLAMIENGMDPPTREGGCSMTFPPHPGGGLFHAIPPLVH